MLLPMRAILMLNRILISRLRLDQLAERFNQLDQRTSSNRDDIRSLHSSLDQFCSVSKTQFLSLRDQLQVLSESSNTVRLPSPPKSCSR